MARKFLTGDDLIEKALGRLASDKVADRFAKSCLNAGLTVVAKSIKKAAPQGASGQLKASIGKRLERNKKNGIVTAKTGVNVGKQKKGKERNVAPHSHLVALGTRARTRKSIGGRFSYLKNPTEQQLSSGTMPANHFVKTAYNSARSAMTAAMQKRAMKKLADEAVKARK